MKYFLQVTLSIFFAIFFIIIPDLQPAFAQTTADTSAYSNTNPDVPQNLHSLTQIVTMEAISTLMCQLGGVDPDQENRACLGMDPQTHRIGFVQQGGGLLGLTMQGITFTFNIPVHTSDYMAYMTSKFGIGEHAYAQTPDLGFTGLLPLIGLWTAFRNIVYLFFIIIFVLVGVGIMFRVQIDPRTVMTLENQLPKIIIGLVLVTFSYAIAGALVDVMWLLTFLIINVLTSTDPTATTNVLDAAGNHVNLTTAATTKVLEGPLGYVNDVLASNGAGGVLDVMGTAAHALADGIQHAISGDQAQQLVPFPGAGNGANAQQGCSWGQMIISSILPPAGIVCGVQQFSQTAANTIGQTLTQIFGWIIGWLLGGLAGLIILIALLLTMFRVWFMLLQAYAYVILDVILAPFHIAAGLIPGSSAGFGTWLRGIASNLLAFPVTVFMFVLARVLLDAFYGNQTVPVANSGILGHAFAATTAGVNGAIAGGSLFQPPLIGSFQGGGANNPLGAFVALAVLFATPEAVKLTKKALQAVDLELGGAALGHIGTGSGALSRVGSGTTAYFHNPMATGAGGALGRLMGNIFR